MARGAPPFSYASGYPRPPYLLVLGHPLAHRLFQIHLVDLDLENQRIYEQLRDEILQDLREALPVDAVMLSLHGAMVATGYDDCEGDLVHRIRDLIGPDTPVGVELDLHCHLSRSLVDDVTALVIFKEYPHTDFEARAEELTPRGSTS